MGTLLTLALMPAATEAGGSSSGSFDWEDSFYVFGSLGLLWCLAHWVLTSSTPEWHPRISLPEVGATRGGAWVGLGLVVWFGFGLPEVCCAVPCRAVLCCAVLCYAVLCCAVLLLCCAVAVLLMLLPVVGGAV